MSAYSNLAGMYPPTNGDIWNSDIAWQPIPVHTVPEELDELLAMKRPCPAYDIAMEEMKKSESYQEFNARFRDTYRYVTKNAGRKISNSQSAGNIYGVLVIEDIHNKTLPEWTKKVYPEPLRYISAESFRLGTYTREMARLKGNIF